MREVIVIIEPYHDLRPGLLKRLGQPSRELRQGDSFTTAKSVMDNLVQEGIEPSIVVTHVHLRDSEGGNDYKGAAELCQYARSLWENVPILGLSTSPYFDPKAWGFPPDLELFRLYHEEPRELVQRVNRLIALGSERASTIEQPAAVALPQRT